MIVQTQVARVDNVVGTGDFDLISVNITPKFSDSDMLIHFYTQWSVAAAAEKTGGWHCIEIIVQAQGWEMVKIIISYQAAVLTHLIIL